MTAVLINDLTSVETKKTIRVASYNVQFLPGIAMAVNKRPHAGHRADRIAEAMSRFDIVGLQETFFEKYRYRIVEGVRNAWGGMGKAVIAPRPKGFYTNGGCLLLTQLPVIKTGTMVFKHFSKPMEYGFLADGFAAKGVVHTRLARSADRLDDFIDVFVTHLEACAGGKVRVHQYQEMAEFIREHSDPGKPCILMGDLNTGGAPNERRDPESLYSRMMAQLNRARPRGGMTDLWPALMGDAIGATDNQTTTESGSRIDYVLIGNPGDGLPQLKPVAIEVNPYLDPKSGALSDHSAVEAELEWVSGE